MSTLCSAQCSSTANNPLDTNIQGNSGKPVSVMTLVSQIFRKLARQIEIRHQQKIDRDAFKQMLSLNDELLDDIGVTRDAVRWAAQLPLEEDAALVLRETVQGGSRVEYR